MSFKEKIAGLDNVPEFVYENEYNLREIIPNIIDEECIKERLTQDQEEILRMFYIEYIMHGDIAERLNLIEDEVYEQEYRAFISILEFGELCGLSNLFEDNLVEKLRKGQEAIEERMEEVKETLARISTKEEIEKILEEFYVLKGVGKDGALAGREFVSARIRKAERSFFPGYKTPEF